MRIDWNKNRCDLPAGKDHFPTGMSVVVHDDGLAYVGRVVAVYRVTRTAVHWYDLEFEGEDGKWSDDEKVTLLWGCTFCPLAQTGLNVYLLITIRFIVIKR